MLTQKIIKLSDRTFHKNNFNLLRTTLLENGYPINIINKEMEKTINKHRHASQFQPLLSNNQQSTITTKYIGIPYVKGLFHKLKLMMNEYNFSLVGYASNAFHHTIFSKLKDPTPKEDKSSIVYEITCECGSQYIGITKQYMLTRYKQHIYDANLKTKNLNSTKKCSALSSHLAENHHKITFDNMKIIEREPKYRKRNILEMLHIKKRNNIINKKTDVEHIQNAYDNIVRL